MTFSYEIITEDYCRAMEFLIEHGCKGGTFSCPDHKFIFNAEFEEQIDDKILKQYKPEEDFSIRRI